MRITLLATAVAATLLLADPAMGFPPKHARGPGGAGGWTPGRGSGPPPWAPAWGWRAKQQQIWTPPQSDDGAWRRGRDDSDQWNDGYRRDGAWSRWRNGYQSPYGQPTYPWGQNGYSWSGQHYQPYGPTQYYSPGTAYPGWHNVYRPAPTPYHYGP